jgi:hypothetical protein
MAAVFRNFSITDSSLNSPTSKGILRSGIHSEGLGHQLLRQADDFGFNARFNALLHLPNL